MWCRINNIPPPTEPITSLGLRAYRKHYRRSKPPQWYTIDHLNALLSTFNPLQLEHYVLLVASFYTLIRPKEILYLTWETLFLKYKYIWLTLSKTDQEGAGTYVRLLPPAFDALSLLSSSTSHQPSDKIFPINQATLNPWLEAKCKQANVPSYTWYALKHGGATFLALSGWSISQIQSHGRWKTEAATRTYIHAPTLSL
jgi:integrase